MASEETKNVRDDIIKEFMEEAATEAGRKKICQQSIEKFRREGLQLLVAKACKELRVLERLDARAVKYRKLVAAQTIRLMESHIEHTRARLEARMDTYSQNARSMPPAHAARYLQRAAERVLAQAKRYEEQSHSTCQRQMERYSKMAQERLDTHRERYGREAMALVNKYVEEHISQQCTPDGWIDAFASALADRLVGHLMEAEVQAFHGMKRAHDQAEEQTEL